MKFNLFFSLFFCVSILSHSFCLYSQEGERAERASIQVKAPGDRAPTDYQEEIDLKYMELPDVKVERTEKESDTFQAKFINMLFLLGLLIGFMILASWALKRLMKTKMTNLNVASNIKVLETRYLSPRATLYLVEIQDRAFLIAESPTTVTYLAHLPIEDESSKNEE